MKRNGKHAETIKIFLVDAFTKEIFRGNPAMVCILDKKIEDAFMQKIAFEFNLSETAFLLPKENNNEYAIRWFTPQKEVPLCGHATLAASQVLFDHKRISSDEIIYYSESGILKAKKDIYGISLDFPLDEPEEVSVHPYSELLKAMGISAYENIVLGRSTKKLIIHLKSQEEVINVQPKYEEMKKLNVEGIKGVGITSTYNNQYHFITRYFNPWAGVNEDPVTGSVHTALAAYWSRILGINELKVHQASYRGGEMTLRIKDSNRLEIIGDARIVFKGELNLDEQDRHI
ncbi:PhzF family phenazine biosynthesis protein [Geosporobacter ferrireducens]|uniref:Phenazine biosynthesis protein PhzF n=1 Tax=Geosporobacter ferrireducens TaxID=1424294 RepID=A0A1D8GID2_9FIRM|nr:PhzF family phenazine biosynthesis protein [Geosporobacter ferrireducens]AOT70650.1 phenazine biosynthesis protein PhzF [Geosporobacter ferrireducens]